jgi:hypothetical protein
VAVVVVVLVCMYVCIMHAEMHKNLCQCIEVYDQLRYLDVDGEILLQCVLSKEGVTAYSTFN